MNMETILMKSTCFLGERRGMIQLVMPFYFHLPLKKRLYGLGDWCVFIIGTITSGIGGCFN